MGLHTIKSLPDADVMLSDMAASKAMKIKGFVLYELPSPWYSVIATQNGLRQCLDQGQEEGERFKN